MSNLVGFAYVTVTRGKTRGQINHNILHLGSKRKKREAKKQRVGHGKVVEFREREAGGQGEIFDTFRIEK